MHDLIDLGGEPLVQLGNHAFDRLDGVIGNQRRVLEGRGRKRVNGGSDRSLLRIALGLKTFFKQ